MPKFCHRCGEILFDENAMFCSFCGTRVVKDEISKTGDDDQPAPQNIGEETAKFNKHSWAGILLGTIPMIIAIFVLLNIYLFPVVKLFGMSFSIAELNAYCSETFFYATFGPHCDQNALYFYTGWLVSVLLTIVGVYEIHYTLKNSP